MKKTEMIDRLMSGRTLMVGTVVHMKKERIEYRDKQTKQKATFDKVTYSLLTGGGVVFLDVDTRKIPGFNFDSYVSPFKTNEKVCIDVDKLVVDKGITTVSGVVSVIQD